MIACRAIPSTCNSDKQVRTTINSMKEIEIQNILLKQSV